MCYVLGKEDWAGRSVKRREVPHSWRVLYFAVVNLGRNLCRLHLVDGYCYRLLVVVWSVGGGNNIVKASAPTAQIIFIYVCKARMFWVYLMSKLVFTPQMDYTHFYNLINDT